MSTPGELWTQVLLAEGEHDAALAWVEGFGVTDPASEGSLEYEIARDQADATWVRAEEARHALDAALHPRRYARRGHRPEALNRFRRTRGCP